jgi:hypothetical protein
MHVFAETTPWSGLCYGPLELADVDVEMDGSESLWDPVSDSQLVLVQHKHLANNAITTVRLIFPKLLIELITSSTSQQMQLQFLV